MLNLKYTSWSGTCVARRGCISFESAFNPVYSKSHRIDLKYVSKSNGALDRKKNVNNTIHNYKFYTSSSEKNEDEESGIVSAHLHAFGRLTTSTLKKKATASKEDTATQFSNEESYPKSPYHQTEQTRGSKSQSSQKNLGKVKKSYRDEDEENEGRKAFKKRRRWGKGSDIVTTDDIKGYMETIRDLHDAEWIEGIHPMFSERARAKAFELNNQNPDFWNPLRLANLFKVDIARMRISLWVSKMERQAEFEGCELDDTIEKGLAARYGELDYPNFIAEIPERINFKRARENYYFIDEEVKSKDLIKMFRSRYLTHYRESTRFPKKPIPPSIPIVHSSLKDYPVRIYPNRFKGEFILVDLSDCYDMYNRPILIRQTDGSWRTGNWQDRRWVEDSRRYIKYPYKLPYPRPDTNEPDNVPEYAKVPEDFVVEFDEPKGIRFLDEIRSSLSESHCKHMPKEIIP